MKIQVNSDASTLTNKILIRKAHFSISLRGAENHCESTSILLTENNLGQAIKFINDVQFVYIG